MNQISKLHSHGQGTVPFSWENKPGVSKATTNGDQDQDQDQDQECLVAETPSLSLKLPPPPCRKESARFIVHDIQIPLPPCAFVQPPSRSSSRKRLDQDPFLAAFKECTKSTTKSEPKNIASRKKGLFNFSCRHSCSVRDDSLIRISQLPCKKDEEK